MFAVVSAFGSAAGGKEWNYNEVGTFIMAKCKAYANILWKITIPRVGKRNVVLFYAAASWNGGKKGSVLN